MISNARTRVVATAATAAPAVAVAAASFVIQQTIRQVDRVARRAGQLARAQAAGPAGPAPGDRSLAPVPPWLPPGRVVSLPGRGEVFVRDSGGSDGDPAVLLLHGWTASADLNFFRVYAGLAASYRVLALDHRGHGRGMRSIEPFTLEDCADDAAALLDELSTEHVIVVGYSMGGPIGLLLARRHPGRVKALVMQATALEWHHTVHERRVWRLLPVLELGLRLGTGAGLVERVLRRAIGQAPELDTYRPWLAAEFRRGLARELTDAGQALSRYDAEPWAAGLGLPAAVVVTARDRLVHPAKQRKLALALDAHVFEADADHDLPMVKGGEYERLTMLAVDTVAVAAGLKAEPVARRPGRRRGKAPSRD